MGAEPRAKVRWRCSPVCDRRSPDARGARPPPRSPATARCYFGRRFTFSAALGATLIRPTSAASPYDLPLDAMVADYRRSFRNVERETREGGETLELVRPVSASSPCLLVVPARCETARRLLLCSSQALKRSNFCRPFPSPSKQL